MSSTLNTLSLDDQSEIFCKFQFDELMKFVKVYPSIQLKDKLWEKVLQISKIPIDVQKLSFMTHYSLYVEHLTIKKFTPSVELDISSSLQEDVKNEDLDSSNIYMIIKFIIKHQFDSISSFEITSPNDCCPKQWRNFISAAQTKTEYRLRMDGKTIATTEGNIKFSFEEIEIVIPFEYCESSFELALKQVEIINERLDRVSVSDDEEEEEVSKKDICRCEGCLGKKPKLIVRTVDDDDEDSDSDEDD